MAIENIYTHTVFVDLIRKGSVVVDCGANEGGFALEMIDRFDCECYCIEPSPDIYTGIPERAGLTKMNYALCGSDRPVELNVCTCSAGTTLMPIAGREGFPKTVTVQGRNLENLATELGLRRIDLVKMDIEGAEMEVLASCSESFIRSVAQWTIEFHDFLGYATSNAVSAEIDRIKKLGFYELHSSKFRSTADVLLVNKAAMDGLQYVQEQYLGRGWRGVQRIGNRLLGNLRG